jgi:hypothetical protein
VAAQPRHLDRLFAFLNPLFRGAPLVVEPHHRPAVRFQVGHDESHTREQLPAQQALFAYLDTLTKTILTCMPEPPADAKAQAIARAREGYDRLLKSAGRAIVGDSKLAMQDLVGDVER